MADLLTRRALAHLDEPMRQIVYALERARDANKAEASRRLNALDYSAEFFAEDAESLQKAIDWICAARAERGMWRQRLATLSHDAGNRLIDEAIDAAEPRTAERDGHVATSDWPMPDPRTPKALQNNELPSKEGGHPRTPGPIHQPTRTSGLSTAAQPERHPMHNVNSYRTDDSAIEQEIQAKGKTAARVTPADIEANIASWWYFTAAEGAEGAAATGTPLSDQPPVGADSPLRLLTFCVLVLRNGFTVTGESACASPENFDAEIGRKIARANAVNKIWPLMGYELKCRLANTPPQA